MGMDISTNFNTAPNTISNAPQQETAAEPHVQRYNGERLSGQVADIVKDQVTIKLPSGEMLKGTTESFPDAKIGDEVKFTVTTNKEGENQLRLAATSEASKDALVKQALSSAGLKADDVNLKLVSLLLEKEMPINKETLVSLSRLTKVIGPENADKALFLLNNGIPATLASVEKLNEYIEGSNKLLKQIESLAKNLMGMENVPEKQKLLEIFEGLTGKTGEMQKGAQTPEQKLAQLLENLSGGKTAKADTILQGAQTQAKGTQTEGAAQNAQSPQSTAPSQNAPASQNPANAAADRALMSLTGAETTEQLKTNTGTALFREAFESQKAATEHLKGNPLPKQAEDFIANNLDKLKAEFNALSQKGEVTKENITSLIKSLPEGERILQSMKTPLTDEEAKSFIIKLAEQSGALEENINKSEEMKRQINNGAKRITDKLSFSIDNKKTEEIERVFENMKDKLSTLAKSLGDGKESEQIKKNIEDIKDNLRFVDRFKNDIFMQIPLTINDQQKQTELYVFSQKQNKNKRKYSQSALLALDLANLGHFETYVQKSEKTVACQFRLEDKRIERLVAENIERLSNALKEKGLNLSNISFKQIDEKFTLTDDEPMLADQEEFKEEKKGRFTFDLRT